MPTLPETSPRPALGCPHFPRGSRRWIFRNWGVVPCARIARALRCSRQRAAAEALGLDPTADAAPCWMRAAIKPSSATTGTCACSISSSSF